MHESDYGSTMKMCDKGHLKSSLPATSKNAMNPRESKERMLHKMSKRAKSGKHYK